MEAATGWISRPFVDANGPDRSDGINGAQSEKQLVLRVPGRHIGGAPTRVFTQLVKDKESSTMVATVESSAWLGKTSLVTAAVDAQNLGADMLYTARLEPRVKYGTLKGRKRLKVRGARAALGLRAGRQRGGAHATRGACDALPPAQRQAPPDPTCVSDRDRRCDERDWRGQEPA